MFARTYPASGGDGSLPHFTSLPQVRTEGYMLDTLADAGVEVHWETPVETVESGERGVRVESAGGAVWEPDYVVGTDGAGSTVRKEIGGSFEGTESENSFLIADVAEVEDDPRPRERVFHYDHPEVGGRNVLLVPFRGGWRVDVQCLDEDAPESLAGERRMGETVARTLGERYRDRVEWLSEYKFKQVTADRMVDDHDRVLLAGEAGHLFAPFGARGMNSGVADAEAAASAITVALNARVEATARAEITRYGIQRLRAAEFNRDATDEALAYEAVETLLVSESLAAETLRPLDRRTVEQGGACTVVPTEIDAHRRLRDEGGVEALLRFPID